MSRSYTATGIILKAMPMGESDRLLTILTVEHGLVRVIAPGARKHKSRLGGRSGQFVINTMMLVNGKQLDKLVQAETTRSFPALGADLGKLTASQYLAELVLCQALSEQPQGDLFALFVEHLERIEAAAGDSVLACLVHGVFHLLVLAGLAPEVRYCCLTQQEVVPDLLTPNWQVEFSPTAGGVVLGQPVNREITSFSMAQRVRTDEGRYSFNRARPSVGASRSPATMTLTAAELAILQRLGQPELLSSQAVPGAECGTSVQAVRQIWQRLEHILRRYAEYHFDRPIRSAALIDACFPVVARLD